MPYTFFVLLSLATFLWEVTRDSNKCCPWIGTPLNNCYNQIRKNRSGAYWIKTAFVAYAGMHWWKQGCVCRCYKYRHILLTTCLHNWIQGAHTRVFRILCVGSCRMIDHQSFYNIWQSLSPHPPPILGGGVGKIVKYGRITDNRSSDRDYYCNSASRRFWKSFHVALVWAPCHLQRAANGLFSEWLNSSTNEKVSAPPYGFYLTIHNIVQQLWAKSFIRKRERW